MSLAIWTNQNEVKESEGKFCLGSMVSQYCQCWPCLPNSQEAIQVALSLA